MQRGHSVNEVPVKQPRPSGQLKRYREGHVLPTHKHTHTGTVVLISLKLAAQNIHPSEAGKTGCACACVQGLPNWAVLLRETSATAGCTCALPPYKHTVVSYLEGRG